MGYEKTANELLRNANKSARIYFAGIANTGIFE
jgi:hypothetical protein